LAAPVKPSRLTIACLSLPHPPTRRIHRLHQLQSKRPYAQLGSVDKAQVCCCCWAVNTDLTGKDEGISPKCGCEEGLVSEIAEELQARKVGRGNIAQLKKQEIMAVRVDTLHLKVDALMAKMNVSVPPAVQEMEREALMEAGA